MAEDVGDDRRERLERLRDQLARAIEDAEPNMLPQLAGQYRATLADLSALPPVVKKVAVKDDLKERRQQRVAANRGATSKAVASSRGKGVKRGG